MTEGTSGSVGLASVEQYLYFRDCLDEKLSVAWQKYQSKMNCKAGCFSCCKNNFRISLMEAVVLRNAFLNLDTEKRRLISIKLSQKEPAELCPLLIDGQCSIYSDRPILCRIFGFPLTDGNTIATCELNFTEAQDRQFSAECFDLIGIANLIHQFSRDYLHEIESADPALPQALSHDEYEALRNELPMHRIEEILIGICEKDL